MFTKFFIINFNFSKKPVTVLRESKNKLLINFSFHFKGLFIVNDLWEKFESMFKNGNLKSS